MKRIIAVMFASLVLALAAPALAQAQEAEHCPDDALGNDAGPGAPPGAINGATGSVTIDGVTVSWDGTTVTVEGGTATLCIKGGISGTTGVITLEEGTYTTDELGLVGPDGQAQQVSYLIVYDTEQPSESPSPSPSESPSPPPSESPSPPGESPPGESPPTPGQFGAPPLPRTGANAGLLALAALGLLVLGTLAIRLTSKNRT